MAAFLLWNVHRRPLDALVRNLIRQHQIDVVLLVEYASKLSRLHKFLEPEGFIRRRCSKRFGVFVRDNHRLARLRYRLGPRVCVWKWTSPSGQDGTIVLLHGLDRRNHDDNTRRGFFRRIADAVRRREGVCGHRRTIVVGDFNAQPFEASVIDADGLHALGVQAVRRGMSRAVSGTAGELDFFYNPMWRLYGRHHPDSGTATSYWLRTSAHEFGWYMLDQVVMRPEESVNFPEERLRIVTQVGNLPLLTSDGVPNSRGASDHLPVIFQWNL